MTMVFIGNIKKLLHSFMQKVWEDRFPIIFIICLAMVMIFLYVSTRVNIKNTYETCTIQSIKTVDRGGTVAGYNDVAPVWCFGNERVWNTSDGSRTSRVYSSWLSDVLD